MDMLMFKSLMHMFVTVFADEFRLMLMSVMKIGMGVFMLMGNFGMHMPVQVFFSNCKICSGQHDGQSRQKSAGNGFPEDQPGENNANKGGSRVKRACSGRSKLPLCGNV